MSRKPIFDSFHLPATQVAPLLLGKYLYHRTSEGKLYRGIITETEAYHGEEDLACHCSKGITPRTKIMYMQGGTIYMYLIYGMYNMLNFVCMQEGFPSAVLIRAVSGAEWLSGNRYIPLDRPTDGPGKLTKRFKIDKAYNGFPAGENTGLWVEESHLNIRTKHVIARERIGVDYAGDWKHKKWNFSIPLD